MNPNSFDDDQRGPIYLKENQIPVTRRVGIGFLAVIQHSQALRSAHPNDDHMFSQCVFIMNLRGEGWKPMHADARQCFGTDFETDPIEFTKPCGAPYSDPFPYDEFTDLVEEYYRYLFGPNGRHVRAYGGEFQENVFAVSRGPRFLAIPDEPSASGAWNLNWIVPPRRRGRAVPLGEMKTELPQSQKDPSAKNLDRENQ